MHVKLFEIRDQATFMPVIAIKPDGSDQRARWLWSRAGYGTAPSDQSEYVLVGRLAGGTGQLSCDPYDWGGGARTMKVAHQHIIEHWYELETGAVIDVQFILKETEEPKVSEQGTVF